MSDRFTELAKELDKESYQWLSENHPAITDALRITVQRGTAPDQIRAFVLRYVGSDRHLLATRCESAARHMTALEKA